MGPKPVVLIFEEKEKPIDHGLITDLKTKILEKKLVLENLVLKRFI